MNLIKKFIPDKLYIQMMFFYHFRKFCDFNNPKSLNEKIQWLKINDRNPNYIELVDKVKVKNYVKNKIGEKYIIPTYQTWTSADEIDISKLPDSFVMKCNHDSHCVFICDDKNSFDIEKAKKVLGERLKYNAYWYGREWPYKNVKPQILVEKKLSSDNNGELYDYKILCFNGNPQNIMVCAGRNLGKLKYYYFDLEWNFLKYQPEDFYVEKDEKFLYLKPKHLNEMIDIARKLSKDIPLVRVDFYETKEQIWFGELTFYPCAGFDTDITKEADILMGKRLNIN